MPIRRDDEDEVVVEDEQIIPEPPTGTPEEVAKRAYQIAWSASNAAAGYHASIIKHLLKHEKKIVGELTQVREDLAQDFADFKTVLVDALRRVGIQIELSPSGDHIVPAGQHRERVASSHDVEELGEKLEQLSEGLRVPTQPGIRSERVKELLGQERARIEAEQQILRLELEKKTMELSHTQELKRLDDQRASAIESNARWMRVAFLIAGGVVTLLTGLLFWAMTRHVPDMH